ncbi:MAG TPA: AtpZ/AtpI family protein [Rhizomicrobium sp.]|nr:AtpZ/AtpI family protein [Rhizomicrobium sp.]
MSLSAQDPQNLRELGKRLDDAQAKSAVRPTRPAPTQMGIAGRFATELMAALLVGGALGWGVDWLFGRFGIHTKPVFLIVLFVLGAAAGIRNVMRAASELNAEMARHPAPPVQNDEER